MVLGILMVVPVTKFYCSSGLGISIVDCSVISEGIVGGVSVSGYPSFRIVWNKGSWSVLSKIS